MDLPDLKKQASAGSSVGSTRMREFHTLVQRELGRGRLESLNHAYVWNDSVLLLGYVDGSPSEDDKCLRDAERLKRRIDRWMLSWTTNRSYAIAVKGQAFPQQSRSAGGTANRVTILRTSSYAMGNCFLIEQAAKKRKLRKSWYLDDRLARHIGGLTPCGFLPVKLMPRNRRCNVHLVEGYLWDGV